MERGIVVCPAKIKIEPNGFSCSVGVTPSEINYFLLYWDKLSAPTDNFIYVPIHEEEDFLISTGILERPVAKFYGSFSGSDAGLAIIESQLQLAEQKMNDKKIDWVIHQFGEEIFLPDSMKASQQILRFDLSSVLPVPSQNVPMVDLLEFKRRRSDECRALHDCMDEIYIDVLASPDPDFSAKKSVDRLRTAIADLERVQKERFKFLRKFDLSIEADGSKLAALGPAAVGLCADLSSGGLTLGLASVAGAAVGALSYLKITSAPKDFFSPAKGKSKLSYLSRARQEKIIK